MISLSHPREWAVWDWLFPPLCQQCDGQLASTDVWFCAVCWADAPVADPAIRHKTRHIDMLRAGFKFAGENLVRKAVHGLKYHGHERLGLEMARRLVPRMPLKFAEADIEWVHVPLHWSRKFVRGFDQSMLLAIALARALEHRGPLPMLRRTRATPSQTGLSHHDRVANVKGAFAVQPRFAIPQRVLLIDDVITTGATVNECARVLKAAGAEWVGALSFAQAEA